MIKVVLALLCVFLLSLPSYSQDNSSSSNNSNVFQSTINVDTETNNYRLIASKKSKKERKLQKKKDKKKKKELKKKNKKDKKKKKKGFFSKFFKKVKKKFKGEKKKQVLTEIDQEEVDDKEVTDGGQVPVIVTPPPTPIRTPIVETTRPIVTKPVVRIKSPPKFSRSELAREIQAAENLNPLMRSKFSRGQAFVPMLWPERTVYYRFDSELPIKYKELIIEVIQKEIESKANFKLVEVAEDYLGSYVNFEKDNESETVACQTQVGMGRGKMAFKMGDHCDYDGVTHEFGHVIGLRHEEQRPDRDLWIIVLWGVMPEMNRGFFSIDKSISTELPYDADSVMQISPEANIKLRTKRNLPIWIDIFSKEVFGRDAESRRGFTNLDIDKIDELYLIQNN